MISDIIANQTSLNIDSIIQPQNENLCQQTLESVLSSNVCPTQENESTIELSKDTYDKIFNHLINELNVLKLSNTEKDNLIMDLNTKIDELDSQLTALKDKLNKMNNINVLIKLKENLTNKQNELSDEYYNEINPNNENNTNAELNLYVNNKNENILIDENTPSLKPKKKPAVFRKRF